MRSSGMTTLRAGRLSCRSCGDRARCPSARPLLSSQGASSLCPLSDTRARFVKRNSRESDNVEDCSSNADKHTYSTCLGLRFARSDGEETCSSSTLATQSRRYSIRRADADSKPQLTSMLSMRLQQYCAQLQPSEARCFNAIERALSMHRNAEVDDAPSNDRVCPMCALVRTACR